MVTTAKKSTSGFLPTTLVEAQERGWSELDVVFVSGDAYVDHPSFAMSILGRVLEQAGYRVGILSQPAWDSARDFRRLGRPRLFFAVSAGNMDSMINHYTANRKPRSDDAYSPGGHSGRRPDRATAVYAQRCREAFSGVPVIAGGVEASLRRIAHYDYWSDTVKPSVIVSSKADLVVFGMGEGGIVEVARRLDQGEDLKELRDMRGVAYLLGKKESIPELGKDTVSPRKYGELTLELPSFEQVKADKRAFARATKILHDESNPFNARRLLQKHGDRVLVQNPPSLPLSQTQMDALYDLPYERAPHPSYGEFKIPAWEMIRNSVTIMRGCFGGCSFCSITAHQGRIIQSRSIESVMKEVENLKDTEGFTGVISDVGGPTANMYEMRCTKPEVEEKCRRHSCVHPTVCKLLGTDHGPVKKLLREVRESDHVKKVFVASGIRTDLAQKDPEYVRELAEHHVGGMLKVAPEHTNPEVLRAMRKPTIEDYESFCAEFEKASKAAGKRQFIVPYFIASHPGSGLDEMIDLALFLKRSGQRPDAVQDFIPAPMDMATAMYYTGFDPMNMKPVTIAKNIRDRKMQRALLQFFKKENYFQVRDALVAAGREDLIGGGPDALIPSRAPAEAMQARRARAQGEFKSRSDGYRPHRRGWQKSDNGNASKRDK